MKVHDVRTSFLRRLGALAIALAGCGKSVADGTASGSSGGAGAGASTGAFAGSGGIVGTGGTSSSTGGSQNAGGSAGTERGGVPNGGGGGAGGDVFARCQGNVNFLTVTGDLPAEYGGSARLDVGCSDAIVGEYPWPLSLTHVPPEAPGMQVQIVACTSDERLKVIIYSNFGQLMGDVDSAITLYVRGAIQGSVRITVDESRTPLANWPFPSDLSEGIGAIYEGSFDNSASMDGGAATVSGSFSVCHVANLPSGR